MSNILIVEDDVDLLEGLCFSLNEEGYYIEKAVNIRSAREALRNNNFDLMLLDCNLPDGTGFELCREIRENSGLAILMLTARDSEIDEVKALNLGVDDYMRKPFSLAVLKARIKKVLNGKSNHRFIESNGITIDKDKGKIFSRETEIEVTAVEYKLLLYLVENKGQILSKDQILSQIWDSAGKFVDDNIVSVNIRRLRVKIEKDPAHPEYIKTVHGMGYLWRIR